ncbi:hypothetical protein [Olleya aquimaris]|uniref:Uncharacterized protein n=1 Tax=Olleya aquimaris TaxID=639310 RepID=A0A327RIV8_9FLAO|nr:hypothetical protein [Olleya aquimaris]RAJ16839.1 hypothetical protein LY08_00615 [Olleya aquimaris]
MKLFIKLFIILFLIDIALGFSITALVPDILASNSLIVKFVDEAISFPLTLYNKTFPEYGIYRSSTNSFWTVIIVNALLQALIAYLVIKLLRKART